MITDEPPDYQHVSEADAYHVIRRVFAQPKTVEALFLLSNVLDIGELRRLDNPETAFRGGQKSVFDTIASIVAFGVPFGKNPIGSKTTTTTTTTTTK